MTTLNETDREAIREYARKLADGARKMPEEMKKPFGPVSPNAYRKMMAECARVFEESAQHINTLLDASPPLVPVEVGRGEVERLRAIVAKLPRTADGVPVTPGMQVWAWFSMDTPPRGGFVGECRSLPPSTDWSNTPCLHMQIKQDGYWRETSSKLSQVFSTKDAADAAKLAAALTSTPAAGGAFGVKPFSAKVELWLEYEGGRVPLSQTGSSFVVPRKAIDIPPCDAVSVVCVDGEEHRRRVRLVNGMKTTDTDVVVQPLDPE